MKSISQREAIKSIRKPIPPATKVERPIKGGGYNRRQDGWKDEICEDDTDDTFWEENEDCLS
jgi:hypothetical protein